MELYKQGAEAKIYVTDFIGRSCLVKERFKKKYRHPELEKSISSQRTKNEVKALIRCRQCGIRTPALYYVDSEANAIYMEYLNGCHTLKSHVDEILLGGDQKWSDSLTAKIGQLIARLHENNIVHGDLTTSNMLVQVKNSEDYDLILIDFGLTLVQSAHNPEDKGVDLYVLERAFLSTHPNSDAMFQSILDSYTKSYSHSKDVIAKLDEVRLRGRKRTMVG